MLLGGSDYLTIQRSHPYQSGDSGGLVEGEENDENIFRGSDARPLELGC